MNMLKKIGILLFILFLNLLFVQADGLKIVGSDILEVINTTIIGDVAGEIGNLSITTEYQSNETYLTTYNVTYHGWAYNMTDVLTDEFLKFWHNHSLILETDYGNLWYNFSSVFNPTTNATIFDTYDIKWSGGGGIIGNSSIDIWINNSLSDWGVKAGYNSTCNSTGSCSGGGVVYLNYLNQGKLNITNLVLGNSSVNGSISAFYDIYMQPNQDVDDYIVFTTPSNEPIIKRVGGSHIDVISDSASEVGLKVSEDGTHSGEWTWEKSNDQFAVKSTHEFALMPNLDEDDYILFQTSSNVPEITTFGSSNLKLSSSSNVIEIDVATEVRLGNITINGTHVCYDPACATFMFNNGSALITQG